MEASNLCCGWQPLLDHLPFEDLKVEVLGIEPGSLHAKQMLYSEL